MKLGGQIARKLKFWGQLEVKLTKSKAKDQTARGAKLQGPNWQNPGGQIEEIESLMVN